MILFWSGIKKSRKSIVGWWIAGERLRHPVENFQPWLTNDNSLKLILNINLLSFLLLKVDEDKQNFLRRWMPEKLSPNVRVVISTIEGTPSHQMLRAFRPSPREIVCGPLDTSSRKVCFFYFNVTIVTLAGAKRQKEVHATSITSK